MTAMLRTAARLAALAAALAAPLAGRATPRVVLISLDGATPRLVEELVREGELPAHEGLGLLARHGVTAERNLVVTPSLTAPSHIAIATGSSAARNDVVANTFHLLASPFASTISGFGAPIGGYLLDGGPAESLSPTARPIWHALRAAGKTVVAATFPGADGVDVKVPGLAGSPVVQPSPLRTVDWTVPFGEFGGQGAVGFTLSAADFGPAPAATAAQLAAAGKRSFSPVLQKTAALERFTVTGRSYTIQVAALDTTDDGRVNYDTLVFFDDAVGIPPGPFQLPSTGPAYVRAADRRSSPFFLEGSAKKAGCAFYVSTLAPDLSTVRVARYAVNDIPPTPAVQAAIDDANAHVGAWGDQADFRIPEKLSPGFAAFPDADLEALYEDQVQTFVDYQTRLALRAIDQNPNADLVMVYIEQPDGSEHQFLLTDPRQPTNPLDPASIGAGQDPAKVRRYHRYLAAAYRVANRAVQRIVDAVGVDGEGRPRADVLVVSDHGFDPFHTAVNMGAILASAGIPGAQVRAVTSGPAVNLYLNLAGRGPGGTVTPAQYVDLQKQLVALLEGLRDTNPAYARAGGAPVFEKVFARPLPASLDDPAFGRGTSAVVGQDSGDVFALLAPGYNFDGTQSPVVLRQGDPPAATPVLSVPNFYGAHGYDPAHPHMSAIFYAAGPDIRRGRLEQVRNIDVAPTIAKLLGVAPDPTVEGRPLDILRRCGGRRDERRDED